MKTNYQISISPENVNSAATLDPQAQQPQSYEQSQQLTFKAMDDANKLISSGDTQGALELYRSWLLQHLNTPLSYCIWYEYGRLLTEFGRWDQAELSFREALIKMPLMMSAHLALGRTLEAQGKVQEALATWTGALPTDESYIHILNNIGRVYEAHYDFQEAERYLLRSLHLDPKQVDVVNALVNIRQRHCAWPCLPDEIKIKDVSEVEQVGPLCSLAMYDDPNANLNSVKSLLSRKGWDEHFEPLIPKDQFYNNHSRIRIGFLSADIRLHATSVFFTPLMEHLNKEDFELFIFDITVTPKIYDNGMSERIVRSCDHYFPLQMKSDFEAAKLIKENEIDILIDLAGLTANARPQIVSRRPAPIQVAYLGFVGSSAMEAMDYVVTTEDMFSAEFESAYTEKPLFLSSYVTIESQEMINSPPNREDFGLPKDVFVFCALLNSYKISEPVFNSWLNIMRSVESGILWLIEENSSMRENLIAYAKSQGINPDRLIFSKKSEPKDYKAKLRAADLFLDTFPYSNGATTHDAILSGLPVLTCPGNTMMSRFSAHLMSRLGLNELISKDRNEYERLAIEYANNPEKLENVRSKLRNSFKTSDLFDVHGFANEFGRALKSVYKKPI